MKTFESISQFRKFVRFVCRRNGLTKGQIFAAQKSATGREIEINMGNKDWAYSLMMAMVKKGLFVKPYRRYF